MKKILIFLCLLSSTMLMAQDIIITNDAQRIEAKIVEASKESIKYLEFNNQDGPTFILSTDDISSVMYQSGKVKVYEHTSKNQVQSNGLVANSMITRSGNTYFYNGMAMKGKTYSNFLKQNCTTAYQQYHNGDVLATVGWVFFGVGLGLDFISIGLTFPDRFLVPTDQLRASKVIGYIGGALEIACIPTLCVGYAKKHKSADTFNAMCAKQPQAYWSINASQNGIGLAYNF